MHCWSGIEEWAGRSGDEYFCILVANMFKILGEVLVKRDCRFLYPFGTGHHLRPCTMPSRELTSSTVE